jgi:hypothetical protein
MYNWYKVNLKSTDSEFEMYLLLKVTYDYPSGIGYMGLSPDVMILYIKDHPDFNLSSDYVVDTMFIIGDITMTDKEQYLGGFVAIPKKYLKTLDN